MTDTEFAAPINHHAPLNIAVVARTVSQKSRQTRAGNGSRESAAASGVAFICPPSPALLVSSLWWSSLKNC